MTVRDKIPLTVVIGGDNERDKEEEEEEEEKGEYEEKYKEEYKEEEEGAPVGEDEQLLGSLLHNPTTLHLHTHPHVYCNHPSPSQ